MNRFGKAVVKLRIPILIISFLLLIPSAIGFIKTRVNYDLLCYLPKDIETMVGQDILVDQFGSGAFSLLVVQGMDHQGAANVRAQIEEIDGVSKVIWYDSFADLSMPMELLPDDITEMFNSASGDATLMAVIFSGTTSDDNTLHAVEEIRKIADKQVLLSGMSAVCEDTKNISNQETLIYVAIAAVMSAVVLGVTMDNFLAPVLFLLSIGMAIVYNLGSNIFLGEVSYVTRALAAVLQLGVTMDYSIFLWHSFEEYQVKYPEDKNRAMAHAINSTLVSIVGSSVTSIAGFLALCFMSFTLGLDLGIVMAKGVAIGVIGCVTVLPAMLLTFEKSIAKAKHKTLVPEFNKISQVVTKKYPVFILIFIVLMFPAVYGYTHYDIYYNLDETLPADLDCSIANQTLKDNFDLNTPHMVLVKNDVSKQDVNNMIKEMKQVDGVAFVLGLDNMIGPGIPDALLEGDLTSKLKSGEYRLILVGSEYKAASDEVNMQCDALSSIIKSYDEEAMLVGESPCTKDLIEITNNDFATVSFVSIGVIFIIIAIIFKSVSLPVILVAAIEFAIFINMGLAYYMHTTLPFVASIVIGTIQLGATVDYAILMTNRYKKERNRGASKAEAISIAHKVSCKSVVVSALSFFAATFGVGVYSDIDMIGSLCTLMSRGAIVSMFVVVFILPSLFMVSDWIICHTTIGFGPKKEKQVLIVERK